MSDVLSSGPATKPGSGRTRRTKVARHAYFVPSDNGGEGGWRFLPIDTAHNQTLQGEDELGNPTRPVDVYAAKGFVPVELVQEGDKRLESLPLNWREVAMLGATPVYSEKVKATASASKASDGF